MQGGERRMDAEEARVVEAIDRLGPSEAYRQRIGENDAWIAGPDLGNGRAIARARTAIHTALVARWAGEQHRGFGYDRPFAVVALGGTGRGEMTPCSDNDFAFLFDGALEGNAFLLELQRQILHTAEFRERHGFTLMALPFSLDDAPDITGKQLNSFLDMRPVYDPGGLAAAFRDRIRATFDPFEHFLHVRGFWKGRWERAAGECERVDQFDIKDDGLRLFLAGIWTLAGRGFLHSHEVYEGLEDRRDLEAYEFLLRIRAFIHLRRQREARGDGAGKRSPDILKFDDFISFGEMLGPDAKLEERFAFGNEVRGRLLSARRRVGRFAKGIIEGELGRGRRVGSSSPIVYGAGGLRHSGAADSIAARDKSRASLSLLLASQRYGVPIDPAELEGTFRNAGDWLVRAPELSGLFYEPKGSLADSFEFLSQIDGATERLFPGYAKYESSLDARVMAERKSLRGALERQKMRALERYVRDGRARLDAALSASGAGGGDGEVSVEIEAAMLDADHLAAVKLALKTKRLPATPDDLAKRQDQSLPLHERHSSGFSGILLEAYFQPYGDECDFTRETLRVAEFLVAHRKAFKEGARAAMNDARQVEEFAGMCGSEQMLRALFVFTCADRVDWESERSDPARWFNTRELYAKAMRVFRPGPDPGQSLRVAGFAPEQLSILRDFGEDFFAGGYRRYAIRFGEHLARMVEEPKAPGAKAALLREGQSVILGAAARDYRGLAATISGALWSKGIDIQQAHLFSAAHYGLAMDFFHIAPGDRPAPADLPAVVQEAIGERRFIDGGAGPGLPRVDGAVSLVEWRPGQWCLRAETADGGSGIIFALTYRTFRYLRGNIFGLTAHRIRGRAYVAVYLSLPEDLSPDEARGIVGKEF